MSNKNWMSLFLRDEKNLQAALVKPKQKILTASPSLNWAMPIYRGYTLCLYGPEGSGKSLISMIALGALMKDDPDACAVLISTEMRAPTPDRLRQLGVDPDRLLIRQANTLQDVFDWIISNDDNFENTDGTKGSPGLSYAIENGFNCKALIIDSIKGIQGPKEQGMESVSKEIMGDISKALNPALRAILPLIRKHELMTILVQQVNMNMNPDEVRYQNRKWIIPSGQALKHFCETMALIERVESKDSKIFDESMQSIRELPVQIGHTIRVRTEKANLDSPFREAELRINYKEGVVDTGLEVVTLAANLGLIKHPLNPETGKEIAAQWVFGNRKWIGFNKVVEECDGNPELQREIMRAVESLDRVPDVQAVESREED